MYDHDLEDLVRMVVTRVCRHHTFLIEYQGCDFYGEPVESAPAVTKTELIARFGVDDTPPAVDWWKANKRRNS